MCEDFDLQQELNNMWKAERDPQKSKELYEKLTEEEEKEADKYAFICTFFQSKKGESKNE